MTDKDTEFTITIKSIDCNEINDFINGYKYKMTLNDIRETLRGTEKYQYEDLAKLNGQQVFDSIKDKFWRIIEHNEVNLD